MLVARQLFLTLSSADDSLTVYVKIFEVDNQTSPYCHNLAVEMCLSIGQRYKLFERSNL